MEIFIGNIEGGRSTEQRRMQPGKQLMIVRVEEDVMEGAKAR